MHRMSLHLHGRGLTCSGAPRGGLSEQLSSQFVRVHRHKLEYDIHRAIPASPFAVHLKCTTCIQSADCHLSLEIFTCNVLMHQ